MPEGRDLESVEHTSLAGRAPLALGLLGLLAWGTVVGGTFQDDDLVGPLGLAGAWRIRPFLRLTFSLQEALHGHRADLLLAGNLALLVVTALGVHALALRRLGSTGAFLAGAAFLLQPAHAEAVAYVSGRSTGLMVALSVWSVWAHLRSVRSDEPRARVRWTAVSCSLLVLAVLSKEVALVVPLLAWAASRWDAPDRPSRLRTLLATAVALGLLLALGFPRYRTLAGWSLDRQGPLSALATYLSALPVQLSLWVRPGALSLVHAPGDGWVQPGLGAGFALALVGAALALRRRAPTASLAAAWALLALLPTHTFLARADVVTERGLHLAWVGPALALGAVLAGCLSRAGSPALRAVVVGAVLVVAVLAGRAVHSRIRVWSDPSALWTEAVARAPGSARAWNNLGLVLLDQEPRAATTALRRAVALSPADPRLLSTLVLMESLCPTDGPRR